MAPPRLLYLLALLALLPGLAAAAPKAPGRGGVPVYKKTFFSEVYSVDKIYKSMKGPASTLRLVLRKGPPELLWLIAYKTEIVGADSDEPLPPDYMCHNNLNIEDLDGHRELVGQKLRQRRLFTLSQGQMEVVFPKGFGVPLVSNESLLAATQVLNHNDPEADFSVRHKTTVRYVRDRDLKRPMKALFQQGVEGLVLLEGKDGHLALAPGHDAHGAGCNLGQAAGSSKDEVDVFGRVFNAHWVVPPGRDVNHTPVTAYLHLEHDTTVHYVAVHLHPFAESIELRDVTTGTSVFRSQAVNSPFKIGLERVEHFSSREGIPIYKDHEYELVSVYNNTSGEPQDSMAVLYLYHWDRDFEKPTFE